MKQEIRIGKQIVGDGHPVYIIAEIGNNHVVSLEIAKHMIGSEINKRSHA